MNKIPNKINIMGQIFDVILEDLGKHASDDIAAGRRSSSKIWIDNTTNKQVQEECLLHEIVEMINLDFELKLEHRDITTLSTAIYQVLYENNLSFGDNKNEQSSK